MPERPVTRRQFLYGAAASALLVDLSGLDVRANASPQAARRALAEPGPMLPPVPAVLLSVNGAPGDPDHLSVVWSFVVNGDPPQIGIAPGHEHVARALVGLHGEFVLNVPTSQMVEAFDRVDMSSSSVGDKFELTGLTRGRATAVDAPSVEEAPVQVECRVFDRVEVPPVRTLYLAEVVATTVHEGVCDQDGRLIVENVDFFGMTAGSGEHYTMGDRVGNIGMTVGRSDIKY